MITLNTVNRSLEYLLGGAVTANQLPFVVNYVNTTREGQEHQNSNNGISNNGTAVTVLSAPQAGDKRSIQSFSVYNADSASATVTVRLNDNATMRNIVVVTLATGDTLIYTSASGWFVLTASGFIKSTSTAVNLDDLGDVVITSVATNSVFVYNGTNWVNQAQANVVNGGTGRAAHTAYSVICGGTTTTAAQQSVVSVGNSGQVLTSNGAGNLPTFQSSSGIIMGTEVASTSGTAVTFTGIPAGVKSITISFARVSTNGTSNYLIQIGDAGGLETSAYLGGAQGTADTSGFIITDQVAASDLLVGHVTLKLEDSANFTWTSSGNVYHASGGTMESAGEKSLSAELDRVSVTTVSGDTFDAGGINIQYQS